ncbi:replication initiation negative regulator SeqA [[Haemophilus] felis]|uniref:Negative modulator of initiation of replication n=1 Tax=[Haemophilus] felis TaxID=123822 RepID=A0A1T0AWB8_9PAST|nr:replication initiation negative regulator SeqA [[Haemophilus] felis]NBI42198.1 replication initiation negative regulator SeqA [[Haemophilus] felis]OOS01021.1 replication initiation regulator SeqA [[Haemophilus] felis]
MKIIEVDEELYQYIASKTESIGESASDILRRLLNFPLGISTKMESEDKVVDEKEEGVLNPVVQTSDAKEEEKPVVVSTRKQSDEAISQVVKKLRALLDSESFQQENKAVVRFLNILSVLYRANPESFAQATETLQGRTRVYFARDEGTLLMAGNHTKPKQIPDTPYWVITNNNSARKMLMLEGPMQSMQLPDELIDEVRRYFIAN